MSTMLIIITVASVVVAIGMSLWALGIAQAERRRSEARVALLESELARDEDVAEAGTRTDAILASEATGTPRTWEEPFAANQMVARPEPSAESRPHDLFADGASSGGDLPRFAVVLTIGVLIVGTITAAGVVFGGAGQANSTTTVSGEATNRPPLELTSLRHQRDGSTWTIVGLVRNPVDASPIEHVTAVTFLFGGSGSFVASGRATLDFDSVPPGAESPFSVRVETPERISRYRIGFRTSDGDVIRHIDRRDSNALASKQSGATP